MSDVDPFYAPNFRPPPRVRRPREHLWSLRKGARVLTCELHFRGESYGWEVQILEDGNLRWSRGAFVMRKLAERWADGERAALEADGCLPVAAGHGARNGGR
jgi:hypothetical protein